MSGPKAVDPCPTCRHLSDNGRVCHALVTHPFKNGVCRAYELKPEAIAHQAGDGQGRGKEQG